MKEQEILFKGKKYLLIGDGKLGSAVATKKQFENGLPSYAHLYKDGNISRYGEIIGTKKDIKYLKKVPVKINAKSFSNLFSNFLGEDF